MTKRTYSEEEVAEIIRRAAEMETGQMRERDKAGSLPGLDLEELSKVAADAGLDPENVRKAAQQLDEPVSDREEAPSQNELFAERWVEGKLTDELTDLIVSDLNHRYSASHEKKSWRDSILEDGDEDEVFKSTVQRTGSSLEWKFTDDYEGIVTRALIQPRKDKVRIRISKKGAWGYELDEDYYESDPVEYLSYVPYLAGFAALFSLQYSFIVNLIIAIVVFSALHLTLVPAAKKLSDLVGDSSSSKKNKRIKKFNNEVERVADDLEVLIGGSEKEPESSDRIEIPDARGKEEGSENRQKGTEGKIRGSGG